MAADAMITNSTTPVASSCMYDRVVRRFQPRSR